MIRLVVDALNPDAATMRRAAAALREGGIVAYPTDTLYALAADPTQDETVTRLFQVKERQEGVPIALIAGGPRQAEQAGRFATAERKLAAALWPGPLTIVVPASAAMSTLLLGPEGTIGVRVPAHTVARALAQEFGVPITATSANISGRPSPVTADEVLASLGDRIDVIVDAGPAPGGPPSTIVLVGAGPPTLVRAGAVPWSRVLESLG